MENKEKKEKKNKLQLLKEQARMEYEDAVQPEEIIEIDTEDSKPLTSKQLIFIEEYTKGNSGTQAAIAAGYAEVSAHVQSNRLLNMPQVQREIQKKYDELAEKNVIEKSDILKDLLEYNRRAMDGLTGEVIGLRALDMINKMLGFYEAEKITVDSKQISINYIIPEKEEED